MNTYLNLQPIANAMRFLASRHLMECCYTDRQAPGKSYAVGKLKASLNWPAFEIDLGAIGSPFIHQTSVTLRKIFDEAKRNAPALVILEELDALAPSRGPMTHDHKIEEVTELLRLVETASENRILVIATTNRRDALDAAILRKVVSIIPLNSAIQPRRRFLQRLMPCSMIVLTARFQI